VQFLPQPDAHYRSAHFAQSGRSHRENPPAPARVAAPLGDRAQSPRSAAGTRRTTARCRRERTAGISELSGATATIDGVLPPAAVRRQRYGSAWHLGFAPEIHELPTHLAEPVVHPGLLAPPDHRAPAFSWPFSLGVATRPLHQHPTGDWPVTVTVGILHLISFPVGSTRQVSVLSPSISLLNGTGVDKNARDDRSEVVPSIQRYREKRYSPRPRLTPEQG
jgi:hypothetical protein